MSNTDGDTTPVKEESLGYTGNSQPSIPSLGVSETTTTSAQGADAEQKARESGLLLELRVLGFQTQRDANLLRARHGGDRRIPPEALRRYAGDDGVTRNRDRRGRPRMGGIRVARSCSLRRPPSSLRAAPHANG